MGCASFPWLFGAGVLVLSGCVGAATEAEAAAGYGVYGLGEGWWVTSERKPVRAAVQPESGADATPYLVAQASGARQPEVLTNESIMQMARAGIDENVIVLKIETSEVNFDLRTESLVALRQASVSDRILGAMLLRAARGAHATTGQSPQPIEASSSTEPTILGEWWHAEESSLEFLKDGSVVARERGKPAPTSARYVLSGGRLKIDLVGSGVSLLDAEVVELTGKVLTLKRTDGTLLVWSRLPVKGGGPTGSAGTPTGSMVATVPGVAESALKRPVGLDELIAGDREASQFSRAEKVLQRDKRRVWDAVMAFLADAGGDVVSSDFEGGYIVTNMKEHMKLITLFRVKYYVTLEAISDHTTKLSALGVRYRREQRTWRKWDRGLVSGGAGQFLVDVVEQKLK
jgi:hypothetical protein